MGKPGCESAASTKKLGKAAQRSPAARAWLLVNLPGLAFEASIHDDVTVDQVTQVVCVYQLCDEEQEVARNPGWWPRHQRDALRRVRKASN